MHDALRTYIQQMDDPRFNLTPKTDAEKLATIRRFAANSPASGAVEREASDRLVTGQAQHLIGALIAHGFLSTGTSLERQAKLWEVVKQQLWCVNREGARAALATQPLEKHPDSLRCIEARNKLNAAMYGEGALIDDLEHAVASACVKLATQTLEQKPVAWGAVHFGGKRNGKLYNHCETEQQIDDCIEQIHRITDRIVLTKAPLYLGPQPEQVAQDGAIGSALSQAFIVSKSAGPDQHYELSLRFKSLPELQAAHEVVVDAIRAARASGQESEKP